MSQSASQPSLKIFISYRRDDSAGHAGRLCDRLSEHFGREQLFMDVDHIEPGEDFVQVIEAAVGSSAVLLVVIGRRWLTSGDVAARRLDNPNDFVRLEVASALAGNVRVIPVLVQDASMPSPQDLPDNLVSLSRRNAIELSDLRWNRDVDQLISGLERFFARQQEAQRIAEQEVENERQREAEAQRQKAEAQRRQQAEQAARATEEKRRREEAEEVARRKREVEETERRRAVERVSATAEGASSPARLDVSPLSIETATPRAALPGDTTERPKKSRLTLMIAGIALVGLIGIALVVWLARGPVDKKTSSAVSQPQSGQQAGSNAQNMMNRIGMEFVWIPAGSFMMGSTNGGDEQPAHQVTIAEPFYMGKYEVTQAQWQQVMGTNPSNFKGDNLPVEQVSWDDAVAFVARLNAQNDGYTYRLPSEAEWEYAARAGTTGNHAGDLDALAWYGNNSGRTRLDAAEIFRTDSSNYYKRITENGGQTHAVGSKLPNAFGLFDMHGNVWEWCQDWYHDSYAGAAADGSAWLSGGEQKYRVLRGGAWYYHAVVLRSASRLRDPPDDRDDDLGFRVVAVART